jgi:hypothetical protein
MHVRRSARRMLLAGAMFVTTFGVALTPAAASDLPTGPLVRVSGTSPFGSCTADNVPVQEEFGDVFQNSEVEPWIDVNPTNPNNMVGMWQQDRWSNGGARGHVVGVTQNGGSTWTQVRPPNLPEVTVCSGGTAANGGNYQRTTDPWVSFGPDGTLHQISLSFNDIQDAKAPFEDFDGFDDFDHALLASKSEDGGLTWSDSEVVIRDTDANAFNDKQSITADPTDADNVYAVWDRLLFPNSEAASVRSSFTTAAFRGPIWFNRSTDGGDSWEDARQIYDPGQNDQTIASQIVVLPNGTPLPNGTLVNLFAEFNGENENKLRAWTVRVLRSTDDGQSWSGPILIDRLQTIAVTDPESGDDVRTGDIIPDVAVNPANGALYAVWQDARFSDFENDSIAFSQSLDGGSTWSDPIKVNATPTNVPAGDQQAFTASVDVASDGTIAVTYYDFQNNTEADSLLTDYWAVHCHPATPTACTDPANWGDENRLTDTPFDMREAPLTTTGFFTGDYEGLASAGNAFTPFFSQTHPTDPPSDEADPSSVFFRRVGP